MFVYAVCTVRMCVQCMYVICACVHMCTVCSCVCSVGVKYMYMNVHICEQDSDSGTRGQRFLVLLYCSPPYRSESGSLTELKAELFHLGSLAVRLLMSVCLSLTPSAEAPGMHIHAQLLTRVLGTQTQVFWLVQ